MPVGARDDARVQHGRLPPVRERPALPDVRPQGCSSGGGGSWGYNLTHMRAGVTRQNAAERGKNGTAAVDAACPERGH